MMYRKSPAEKGIHEKIFRCVVFFNSKTYSKKTTAAFSLERIKNKRNWASNKPAQNLFLLNILSFLMTTFLLNIFKVDSLRFQDAFNTYRIESKIRKTQYTNNITEMDISKICKIAL